MPLPKLIDFIEKDKEKIELSSRINLPSDIDLNHLNELLSEEKSNPKLYECLNALTPENSASVCQVILDGVMQQHSMLNQSDRKTKTKLEEHMVDLSFNLLVKCANRLNAGDLRANSRHQNDDYAEQLFENITNIVKAISISFVSNENFHSKIQTYPDNLNTFLGPLCYIVSSKTMNITKTQIQDYVSSILCCYREIPNAEYHLTGSLRGLFQWHIFIQYERTYYSTGGHSALLIIKDLILGKICQSNPTFTKSILKPVTNEYDNNALLIDSESTLNLHPDPSQSYYYKDKNIPALLFLVIYKHCDAELQQKILQQYRFNPSGISESLFESILRVFINNNSTSQMDIEYAGEILECVIEQASIEGNTILNDYVNALPTSSWLKSWEYQIEFFSTGSNRFFAFQHESWKPNIFKQMFHLSKDKKGVIDLIKITIRTNQSSNLRYSQIACLQDLINNSNDNPINDDIREVVKQLETKHQDWLREEKQWPEIKREASFQPLVMSKRDDYPEIPKAEMDNTLLSKIQYTLRNNYDQPLSISDWYQMIGIPSKNIKKDIEAAQKLFIRDPDTMKTYLHKVVGILNCEDLNKILIESIFYFLALKNLENKKNYSAAIYHAKDKYGQTPWQLLTKKMIMLRNEVGLDWSNTFRLTDLLNQSLMADSKKFNSDFHDFTKDDDIKNFFLDFFQFYVRQSPLYQEAIAPFIDIYIELIISNDRHELILNVMKFDSKVSELFFNSPLISSKHNLFWETIPYKLMSIEEWRENQWLNFFNPCDFNQYQQAMFCSPGLFKPLPRSIGSSETRCLYELISSRKNTNIMLLGCFASIFDTRVYSIDYEKNKVKKLHGFKLSVNHQKILSTILKIIQYEAGLKFLFDHISVLQGAVDEIERVKAVKLIVLAYSTLDEKFKQKTFNIMYTNLIGMSSYPFIDILRELKIYQKFSKNEDIQYQHIMRQINHKVRRYISL